MIQTMRINTHVMPAGIAILLTVSLLAALPVFAATGFDVSAGVSNSDNITRSNDNPIEETVSDVSLSLSWDNQSPRLSATAFGQVSHLHYFNGTFDDRAYPRGILDLNYAISPARLSWALEDRYGQIASDPFESFTPDNIEDTNIVRTGPDLIFGSNSSQTLTIGVRAEDQWYEIQPFDNQRLNSTIRLQRSTSQFNSVAITAFGESVRFEEDSTGVDFDRYEAFLTFQTERPDATANFLLDIGGTSLSIEDETFDGFLSRLTASRAFDPYWFVELTGEYSFSDSGNRFFAGRSEDSPGADQGVDDDNLVASASPLRLRRANMNLSRNTNRSNLTTFVFWETERYELEPDFDRDQFGATLTYRYRISPLNSVELFANYKDVQFTTIDRSDEIFDLDLRFRRSLNSNLSLTLRAARLTRESSNIGSEYEEYVYGLILTYRSDGMIALQNSPSSRGR